jgi:hypothetical protein
MESTHPKREIASDQARLIGKVELRENELFEATHFGG